MNRVVLVATAIGFAILGPLAVVATAAGSDLAGLAERGPIGLFLLWLLVVGWFGVTHGSEGLPRNAGRRATAGGAHRACRG